jgi:hypothetical protein
MNGLNYNYDGPLEPPSNEAYDLMVENVCDMKVSKLRRECENRDIDTDGATLEALRDALIDAIAWELDL